MRKQPSSCHLYTSSLSPCRVSGAAATALPAPACCSQALPRDGAGATSLLALSPFSPFPSELRGPGAARRRRGGSVRRGAARACPVAAPPPPRSSRPALRGAAGSGSGAARSREAAGRQRRPCECGAGRDRGGTSARCPPGWCPQRRAEPRNRCSARGQRPAGPRWGLGQPPPAACCPPLPRAPPRPARWGRSRRSRS